MRVVRVSASVISTLGGLALAFVLLTAGASRTSVRWSRLLRVAGGVATLTMVATPGFAYFKSAGNGAGAGATGTLQPLQVLLAAGTPTSSLLPGSTADLVLSVTNPNSVTVTITSVSQAGGVTVTGAAGCTSDPAWPTTLGTSGVSIPGSTGLSQTVGAGATAVVHVSGGAAMSTSSVSACQGATFRMPVTVKVQ